MRQLAAATALLLSLVQAPALLMGADGPIAPPVEDVVLDDGRHLLGTYDEEGQVLVLAAPGHARLAITRDHVLSHQAFVRHAPRPTTPVASIPASAPPAPAEAPPEADASHLRATLVRLDDQLANSTRRLEEARDEVASQERFLTRLGQRWTWLSQRLAVTTLPELGFETDLTFSLRTVAADLVVQRGVLAQRQRRVAELEQRLAALRVQRTTQVAEVARATAPTPAATAAVESQGNLPEMETLRGELQRLRRDHEQLKSDYERLRQTVEELRSARDQRRPAQALPTEESARADGLAMTELR